MEAELVLHGPARVHVKQLGLVQGPVASVDGDEKADVAVTVQPESVAHYRDGELHAVGPGEATVVMTWQDQTVEWVLHVETDMTLYFDAPPAMIAVGQSVPLKVLTHDAKSALTHTTWVSSDSLILSVDTSGVVTGVSPGVAYVTVAAARSQAMLEISVR